MVINNATDVEEQEIAENLTKYFTNMGPNLVFKIPNKQGSLTKYLPTCNTLVSSVKWSDPGHLLKSQGKFFLSFPCTLFYKILTPKNYKSSL